MCRCRLESIKSVLVEARTVEDLVTSYERQLSQLAYLSADSATLRQIREQLQVCFMTLPKLRLFNIYHACYFQCSVFLH